MSIFGSVTNVIEEVGFGVIKHSGRIAWGGGKAILGVVTDDKELIDEGLSSVAKSSVGLGVNLISKVIFGNDSNDTEVSDNTDFE